MTTAPEQQQTLTNPAWSIDDLSDADRGRSLPLIAEQPDGMRAP